MRWANLLQDCYVLVTHIWLIGSLIYVYVCSDAWLNVWTNIFLNASTADISILFTQIRIVFWNDAKRKKIVRHKWVYLFFHLRIISVNFKMVNFMKTHWYLSRGGANWILVHMVLCSKFCDPTTFIYRTKKKKKIFNCQGINKILWLIL